MPGPQLVLSSATLRRHLNNYLYEESGWLNGGHMAKVKDTGSRPVKKSQGISGEREGEEKVREAGRSGRVKHCVIEVSDQEIRNVEGAVKIEEEKSGDEVVDVTEELGQEAQKIFSNTADERQVHHETEIQGGV